MAACGGVADRPAGGRLTQGRVGGGVEQFVPGRVHGRGVYTSSTSVYGYALEPGDMPCLLP